MFMPNNDESKYTDASPSIPFGASQTGKSSFNWDVYKNRKSALQHLRRNCTLIDTILETEDGTASELVHSQVISAFGERLSQYIHTNGCYVDSYRNTVFHHNRYSLPKGVLVGQAQRKDFASQAHTISPQSTQLVASTSTSNSFKGNNCVSQKTVIANGAKQEANATSKQPCWSRWPGKVKLIRLPKFNRYTLGILVECAYSGYIRTDLQSGGIWQVLEVADHYEIFDVIRACCAFLIKNLDRYNCVKFYHIGSKYRHQLQRCAWHKIRANFKYILETDLSSNKTNGARPEEGQQGLSNNLASIKYEHFEHLLLDDKLNVEREESIWFAIKLWCEHDLEARAPKVTNLLPCMRFPRFRQGPRFSVQHIWCDPLILHNNQAQHQLAILDRNHRDFLAGLAVNNLNSSSMIKRDGFALPCAPSPRQLRPRIPHSILLAIGGWQHGQPTTLIESYDVNCNLWFESHKSITSRLAYHGIEYINSLLYICGGTDGNEILNELFTFDPVRGDCQQRPSMREPRCYVSTAYLDGHLYAMGGHNGSQRMKSVERYQVSSSLEGPVNNSNGVWSSVSDMNVARSDASACVRHSYIYIAGGLNDHTIESSVEFYNCQDNSWTFISSMQTPRTSFTMLLYQDHLIAIGGNNGQERLNSVEQYSFKSKLWAPHSQMRERRSTFSAALLDESKLVVVGGYNGSTPFNKVEMFDQQQGEWVELNRIRFDRSGLKVVVVSDLPNATEYTYLGPCRAAA